MPPAARVGDMHVCPMVTPGLPPTQPERPTAAGSGDGVRKRGWIFAHGLGSAPAAAIESEVREPGRIVVCADEMPEMITAITTSFPGTMYRLAASRASGT